MASNTSRKKLAGIGIVYTQYYIKTYDSYDRESFASALPGSPTLLPLRLSLHSSVLRFGGKINNANNTTCFVDSVQWRTHSTPRYSELLPFEACIQYITAEGETNPREDSIKLSIQFTLDDSIYIYN